MTRIHRGSWRADRRFASAPRPSIVARLSRRANRRPLRLVLPKLSRQMSRHPPSGFVAGPSTSGSITPYSPAKKTTSWRIEVLRRLQSDADMARQTCRTYLFSRASSAITGVLHTADGAPAPDSRTAVLVSLRLDRVYMAPRPPIVVEGSSRWPSLVTPPPTPIFCELPSTAERDVSSELPLVNPTSADNRLWHSQWPSKRFALD